jgi:iron complex outermembrane receptor protein
MNRYSLLLSAGLATLATIASQPALAQATSEIPQADSAGETADTPGENDIVVTAQRRSEYLSRTPVAVTAISAESLAKNVIQTQADLQIAAPGLVVKASTNANDLNFSIRGQSLDAFSGARPGVLPYFNEVQIGGQGTSSSFYDLQSIQVLKGPQGTLFGRNSTGGAVLFTSQTPKSEFGGYVSGSLGNFASTNIEGAINAPLDGNPMIFRVAGIRTTNHGYQRNVFNGAKFGGPVSGRILRAKES